MSEPIHVVDATMFWSATGGGVRRYLLAKQAWLRGRPGWRHTIAVPGVAAAPGMATIPAIALPGTGGYRLPLRRAAVARALADLQPGVIEAGDPYRVAWSARDAASTLGIPAVAYCHSNLEAMARLVLGRGFGDLPARTARRYLRHVYAGFDLVLAPSEDMLGHLIAAGIERAACQPLGVDTRVFHPSRASAAWRTGLGLDADARVLVYAGRFAPEKHLDVLAAAVAALGAARAGARGRTLLAGADAGRDPRPLPRGHGRAAAGGGSPEGRGGRDDVRSPSGQARRAFPLPRGRDPGGEASRSAESARGHRRRSRPRTPSTRKRGAAGVASAWTIRRSKVPRRRPIVPPPCGGTERCPTSCRS